jgi:hypothetical protein
MARTSVRLVVASVVSAAGLLLASGTALAVGHDADLGTYGDWGSCFEDAANNATLGFPGTFECSRGDDGLIHQWYNEPTIND